eukprot:1150026-Pelagomonas_calceolata.AAC.4
MPTGATDSAGARVPAGLQICNGGDGAAGLQKLGVCLRHDVASLVVLSLQTSGGSVASDAGKLAKPALN